MYAQLVDLHNTIVDATNKGQLQLNDEQTKYVNEAADLINEMGELDKSDFKSEDDAVAIAKTIGQLAEALGTIVGA